MGNQLISTFPRDVLHPPSPILLPPLVIFRKTERFPINEVVEILLAENRPFHGMEGQGRGKTEYNQGIVYNTHMNEIHLLLSSIIGFHTPVEMKNHRDSKQWKEAQYTDPRIIWISVFLSASRPFPPHDRRSNRIFRITRYTGQRIRNDRCP